MITEDKVLKPDMVDRDKRPRLFEMLSIVKDKAYVLSREILSDLPGDEKLIVVLIGENNFLLIEDTPKNGGDDEVYRSIYGLGAIPDEVKHAGLGGVNRYAAFDALGGHSSLGWSVRRLDDLTKRAYIQSKALDEVGQISREAGDMVSCVPSVPPLLPDASKVHLSSGFGYRTDPVYGGGENHGGQDFATDKGTPVYATGDGTVLSAQFQFSGYGNEIIIDHGYGYKTRYAHLNTIIINEGMKVKRGEQIGTVGATGKVTGAHLHYEVLYQDNRVDPMNFMDFNMPLDEYRAMIGKRKEDSPVGKRSSTTELLRRRRKGNG